MQTPSAGTQAVVEVACSPHPYVWSPGACCLSGCLSFSSVTPHPQWTWHSFFTVISEFQEGEKGNSAPLIHWSILTQGHFSASPLIKASPNVRWITVTASSLLWLYRYCTLKFSTTKKKWWQTERKGLKRALLAKCLKNYSPWWLGRQICLPAQGEMYEKNHNSVCWFWLADLGNASSERKKLRERIGCFTNKNKIKYNWDSWGPEGFEKLTVAIPRKYEMRV